MSLTLSGGVFSCTDLPVSRFRSRQECEPPSCYVWCSANIYFLKSLDVTRPSTHWHWLCGVDHQHLKRWSTFCLSSRPLPITQHKRWKVAAAARPGHAEGSCGSGDPCGARRASPLAVCPQPSWPLDNEPFWALRRATQPFNPRPDLVSAGGEEEEEVGGAPHVRWKL